MPTNYSKDFMNTNLQELHQAADKGKKLAEEERMTEAFPFLLAAEELEDPEVLYNLANCFLDGEGVTENHEIGISKLRKSSTLGYLPAKTDLGMLLFTGEKTIKAPKEGLQLLKEAAEQHFAGAEFKLGMIYFIDNPEVEKNDIVAIKWFKRSGEQGHPFAIYALFHYYFEFGMVDLSEILYYLDKLKFPTSTNLKSLCLFEQLPYFYKACVGYWGINREQKKEEAKKLLLLLGYDFDTDSSPMFLKEFVLKLPFIKSFDIYNDFFIPATNLIIQLSSEIPFRFYYKYYKPRSFVNNVSCEQYWNFLKQQENNGWEYLQCASRANANKMKDALSQDNYSEFQEAFYNEDSLLAEFSLAYNQLKILSNAWNKDNWLLQDIDKSIDVTVFPTDVISDNMKWHSLFCLDNSSGYQLSFLIETCKLNVKIFFYIINSLEEMSQDTEIPIDKYKIYLLKQLLKQPKYADFFAQMMSCIDFENEESNDENKDTELTKPHNVAKQKQRKSKKQGEIIPQFIITTRNVERINSEDLLKIREQFCCAGIIENSISEEWFVYILGYGNEPDGEIQKIKWQVEDKKHNSISISSLLDFLWTIGVLEDELIGKGALKQLNKYFDVKRVIKSNDIQRQRKNHNFISEHHDLIINLIEEAGVSKNKITPKES